MQQPAAIRRGSVLLALVLSTVGCGGEDVVEVREWVLVSGDRAPAQDQSVTLPAHLGGHLGTDAGTYRLRADVDVPAAWLGGPITLAVPTWLTRVELLSDGVAAASIGGPRLLTGTDGWHAWRVVDVDGDGRLALELVFEYDRTYSGWIDSAPRLSPTTNGDSAFTLARSFDVRVRTAALGALVLIVVIYLALWLWDRGRTAHVWFALQALCAFTIAAHQDGLLTATFGHVGEPVSIAAWGLALMCAVEFFYAHFDAGRVPRSVNYATIGAVAAAVISLDPFRGVPLALWVQAPFVAFIVLHMIAFLVRARRRYRYDATIFLAAWGLIFIGAVPDSLMLSGGGHLLGGARVLPLMFIGFAILQMFVIARHQIMLAKELELKVAVTSRELAEALARRPAASAQVEDGVVIDDRYRVVRQLGRGAMGVVSEAERLRDGRRVAIKTLSGTHDPHVVARFAREAQVATTLDHPNLVRVVDVGVSAELGLFLVMDLVDGTSVDRCSDRYGDLDWAWGVLRQVAMGLAAIHGAGVVHRDLKPANVLLSGSNPTTVKITDFGVSAVARAQVDDLARTVEADNLTQDGMRIGTPLYMAPEVAAGNASAGAPADLWSFGVMAHELVTSRLPFETPPLLDVLAGRPVGPPVLSLPDELDPALAALIEQCLSLDPDVRPDAETLAAALA